MENSQELSYFEPGTPLQSVESYAEPGTPLQA